MRGAKILHSNRHGAAQPTVGAERRMIGVGTMSIRTLTVAIALVTAFLAIELTPPALAQQSVDYDRAINMAGRQRMLSQRMAKEAILISLGVDVEENMSRLRASRDLFARTLTGLKTGDESQGLAGTSDNNTIESLEEAEAVWAMMDDAVSSGLAAGWFSEDQIALVVDLSPMLLNASEGVVTAYLEEVKTRPIYTVLVEAINVSGRQRMLSQRMAMQYFLIARDVDSDDNRQALQDSIQHFDRALAGLIDGDPDQRLIAAPTVEIQLQLATVRRIWSGQVSPLMYPVLNGNAPSAEAVDELARLNLELLREMNLAVEMYEML